MRVFAAAILGCTALAGCETSFGLVRTGALHAPPSLSCIEGVLVNISGVRRVDSRSYDGAYRRPIARFAYLYAAPDNSLLASEIIVEQAGESVAFRNVTLSSLDNISQPRLEAARATMIEVEQRLVHECGLQELQSVAEHCKGSSCER